MSQDRCPTDCATPPGTIHSLRNKCQVFDLHVIYLSQSQGINVRFSMCEIPFTVIGINVRFLICKLYAFNSLMNKFLMCKLYAFNSLMNKCQVFDVCDMLYILRNKCHVFDVYMIYFSQFH